MRVLSLFLGIPYAKPPVGELRFAPPVPGEPWGDTLDAMDFGPACPQPEIDPSDVMNWKINEDCLTLNVWTPSVDNQKRAVMFWIHGGGYIWESSGDQLLYRARMAVHGHVVVISVEYRLGAFRFSYLEDVPGSGNAGLLDQILALRWVRDNIAAFGGNPDNVTIWGESAGSYSVCALLGMPVAKGLFHKAHRAERWEFNCSTEKLCPPFNRIALPICGCQHDSITPAQLAGGDGCAGKGNGKNASARKYIRCGCRWYSLSGATVCMPLPKDYHQISPCLQEPPGTRDGGGWWKIPCWLCLLRHHW